MEKQKITVSVAGKPYTLVSADPPEYVKRVAAYVDRKMRETMTVTNLPAAQAAVLACFNLAEEVMKAQDENRVLRRQIEEQSVTND
ncbi:MAG: cell division protein ZapA [Clostridia bacterium]|nr:cell division protein ZapA [Clostridia bacterium]